MARKVEERNNPMESFSGKTKAFLKEFVIVFGAFLVLNSFVIASFEVPTGSMENEIMTGDFLLVNKFVFGGTTPKTIPFTSTRIPSFKLPALWDVERGRRVRHVRHVRRLRRPLRARVVARAAAAG